jgi:hypothetical protein
MEGNPRFGCNPKPAKRAKDRSPRRKPWEKIALHCVRAPAKEITAQYHEGCRAGLARQSRGTQRFFRPAGAGEKPIRPRHP